MKTQKELAHFIVTAGRGQLDPPELTENAKHTPIVKTASGEVAAKYCKGWKSRVDGTFHPHREMVLREDMVDCKTRPDHMGSMCKACVREQINEYNRANPEKKREQSRKWQENNPEKRKESVIKYRENNWEKVRESNRNYRENNLEKERERVRKAQRKRRKENPEREKATRARRKAMKKALPRDLSDDRYEEICSQFADYETPSDDIEHFIPLDWGQGGTTEYNCYPFPSAANTSKGNRNPFEWYESIGQYRDDVTPEHWEFVVSFIAKQNGLTVPELKAFVKWCETHKRTVKQTKADNARYGYKKSSFEFWQESIENKELQKAIAE